MGESVKLISSGIPSNGREYYSSTVGIWYEVLYSSKEESEIFFKRHRYQETRCEPKDDGLYSSGDKDKLKKDFSFFKRIGIDYVALDDTNHHMVDNGFIAAHCDSAFEVAGEMGESAPKICIAAGRPLVNGDLSYQKWEMDVYYDYCLNYAKQYFRWKGKPLYINFNDPWNYGYDDVRFTVRHSSGSATEAHGYESRFHINKNGLYGWVYNCQYEKSEVYGITPGWSRSHNGLETLGFKPISRENGEHYRKEWLNAVKANKEMIVITGWNEHGEETGIEAVTLREPIEGRELEHLNPYFYEQMTEGYLALKTGFLEGFYYQSEQSDTVYIYQNGELTQVPEVPLMMPVILVPSDYFEWTGVKING